MYSHYSLEQVFNPLRVHNIIVIDASDHCESIPEEPALHCRPRDCARKEQRSPRVMILAAKKFLYRHAHPVAFALSKACLQGKTGVT